MAVLSTLLQLERSCFSRPYTEEQIRNIIDHPSYLILATGPEGRPDRVVTAESVAYLIAHSPEDGLSELHRIAVLPAFRRNGLGRCLLEAWIEHSSGLRLLLEVASKNTAALSLYRSYGFKLIGTRKRYYADNDDALIFEREAAGS